MTHALGHTEIEPVGSPRRVCIDAGGRWDEETQTCDMRKEVKPKQVPKGEQVFVTTAEGRRVIQTPETLAEDRRRIEVEAARAEAIETGRLSATQALERNIQKAAIEAERQKLIAEQTPEILPLQPRVDPGLGGDPQAIGGELFPIIGPLGTLTKKNFHKTPLGMLLGAKKGEDLAGQKFPEGINVVLRNEALTEIANRELDRGLSDNEKVGEFVEALGLGDLTNFAAEKPSENVQTVLKGIRILKSDATDVETKVIRGTLTKALAEDRLDELEGELIRASFRIQMLIQSSPEFKFDSDGVNFIEQKILQANRRIFDARLGILSGEIQDPTDLQIALDLQAVTQRGIAEESFEI